MGMKCLPWVHMGSREFPRYSMEWPHYQSEILLSTFNVHG